MANRDPIRVDVTPGEHSFLDALAIVSFKLGCNCNVRMTAVKDASRAVELKQVGSTYPCNTHGEQIITRATTRLCGWQTPPAGHWRPE